MDVLVLGGTHHVGRCVVEAALARGDRVTTVTRGVSGPPAGGSEALYADRTDVAALRDVLGARSWDAAVDTWSGAPHHVKMAVTLLAGRVPHYSYVSSRSVYQWPIPVDLDESGPVVDGDPDSAEESDYAVAKRGGELAALDGFGDHALIARAGLILGPYEQIGRLPWWLRRLEKGGRVLCPGPMERPLQYIDGRDLAEWLLTQADQRMGGVFNTVSRPGHTTMAGLLEAARTATSSGATLVWASPALIEEAGIAPWTQLPIWLPPDGEASGLHAGNVDAAFGRGLRCRPVAETVADTWVWLQKEGDPAALSNGTVGLSLVDETAVLAKVH